MVVSGWLSDPETTLGLRSILRRSLRSTMYVTGSAILLIASITNWRQATSSFSTTLACCTAGPPSHGKAQDRCTGFGVTDSRPSAIGLHPASILMACVLESRSFVSANEPHAWHSLHLLNTQAASGLSRSTRPWTRAARLRIPGPG